MGTFLCDHHQEQRLNSKNTSVVFSKVDNFVKNE